MSFSAVPAYIEIEKDSNIKYEYDKNVSALAVDRILPEGYYYPFAYGFFPNTLAADGDELDVLILRATNDIRNNHIYPVHILGALVMEDEKGMDEKVLCVLSDDYQNIQDITQLEESVKNKISTFFSTYKINTPGKWSKTYGFLDKKEAIKLYKASLV
jgi:inorganic pyrophosphatase